jgi:uncharacterized protein (TIGR00251 family)
MAPGSGIWRLQVHVQPRASRTRIVGRHGDALKVQVQATPVGGAANAAVVALLAETLGVPPRAVRLRHGAASRDKLFEVETTDLPGAQQRLEAALRQRVDKAKARG